MKNKYVWNVMIWKTNGEWTHGPRYRYNMGPGNGQDVQSGVNNQQAEGEAFVDGFPS